MSEENTRQTMEVYLEDLLGEDLTKGISRTIWY